MQVDGYEIDAAGVERPFHDADLIEAVPFERMSHSQRAAFLAANVWVFGSDDELGPFRTALAQVYATLAVEDAIREAAGA